MIATPQQTFVTADEFERMPDVKGCELVDGRIVEAPEMGMEASWTSGQVLHLLRTHCHPHRFGWVFDSEAEYNCFPGRPNLVRRADVSFLRFGRLLGERLPRGRCRLAPDLAVEVISPSNASGEIDAKVGEYLDAGVGLVWVVSPVSQTVTVFHPDGSAMRLTADKELSGEEILPGFAVRVADLFPPSPTPSA